MESVGEWVGGTRGKGFQIDVVGELSFYEIDFVGENFPIESKIKVSFVLEEHFVILVWQDLE